jgi:hypothetical protein
LIAMAAAAAGGPRRGSGKNDNRHPLPRALVVLITGDGSAKIERAMEVLDLTLVHDKTKWLAKIQPDDYMGYAARDP